MVQMATCDADRPAGFGALLRRYRLDRGFSQEALAERASISTDGIRFLESGRRRAPYRDTVALLARALDLAAPDAAALESSVVRRRAPAPTEPWVSLPPVPRSAAHRNLPAPTTTLLGRGQDVAGAVAMLRGDVQSGSEVPSGTRLLTLIGPGGVGKTRVALEVAHRLLDQPFGYRDGVWLVELAALSESTLVAHTVATTLGLRETPGTSLLISLTDYLAAKRLLVVLDNCEHLIEACAELATAVLRVCPNVHILATGRESLGIVEETVYRVPSLACPDPNQLPAVDVLPSYSAVALLLQRAQAKRADVVLTAHNARAIAQICARLDGMPLAIELAAARLSAMTVEQVAARLDDCFTLLTGGSRTAMPRQRTLRATLDWSYDLLNRQEQVLLRRLSVFMGGWTLDAAEAICADAGWDSPAGRVGEEVSREGDLFDPSVQLTGDAVLDVIAGLVDKSLVLLEVSRLGDEVMPTGEARYRLLETVRQYGQEKLDAAVETTRVRDRHLAWYLALAEEGAAGIKGQEQVTWLQRLELEHDNLRTALAWSVQSATRHTTESKGHPFEREPEAGLRLAGALWWFWVQRGHLSEGLRWLEEALAAAGSAVTVARVRALIGAGYLTMVRNGQGDHPRARAMFEESLGLSRALGDRAGSAQAQFYLAMAAQRRSDRVEARRLYEASLALFREQQDRWFIARTLCRLGTLGPWIVQGVPDM
jgi:predicted ATPase